MSAVVAVARVGTPTSTGTQDVTHSDLAGHTVKAVWALAGSGITDGSLANHLRKTYYVADASTQRGMAGYDEDNLGTSDSGMAGRGSLSIPNLTGGVIAGADFNGFITNGVQFNWWGVDASNSYLVTYVLFAGSDVSAHVGDYELGNSIDNLIHVTDVGFEADLVIPIYARNIGSSQATLFASQGFVHNDGAGGITQRSHGIVNQDNRATTRNSHAIRDDSGIHEGIANSAGYNWRLDFSNFDSSGFDMHTRNAGGDNENCFLLALSFGGAVNVKVGHHTGPTATGNHSNTAVGFKPQFVAEIQQLQTSIPSGDVNAPMCEAYGIGVWTASDAFANTWGSEDNVSTSDTVSGSDDIPVWVEHDTAEYKASYVSLNSDGYTNNYSVANPATGGILIYLAIEEEAAAALPAKETKVLQAVNRAATY